METTRVNAAALLILIAVPALAFFTALHREVRLARLEGIDARCMVCDRKATRTLKRIADGLHRNRVYVYDRAEFSAGMPVWCDLHGPDKLRENSRLAYFAALASFALAGTVYEKLRRG